MALDNAQFIAELSVTDPPGTDPLSQGDDHIRTVKRATQQSFPNIDAAVTFDAATLNLAAIKNQANLFTVSLNRFTDQVDIKKASGTSLAGHFYIDENDFARWGLFLSTTANANNFTLQRRDAVGALLDLPFTVSNITGVMDFAHVPTVEGAPLWIAGELRMFAAAASPGTNWFLADGTNGTVDMTDRAVLGSGTSVAGTALAPNLVGTAAAGNTGAHVLTSGQMPAHDHGLLGGSVAGVAAGLLQSNARGCLGQGSMTPSYVFTTGFGDNLMQATGLNQAHSHTSPAQAVTENGTGRDTVRPLSRVVEMHQYVP